MTSTASANCHNVLSNFTFKNLTFVLVRKPFRALMTGKLWLNYDSSLFSGAEMSKFGSLKKCQK
jgi:hypothetical protein